METNTPESGHGVAEHNCRDRSNNDVRRKDIHKKHLVQNTSWHFGDKLAAMLRTYEAERAPIPVNFREIVPMASGVDRATHLLHSYPAKLLLNIPLFFANCEQLVNEGDLIVDPFCGTGTTLVEAVLARKRAAGSDANPLARLIARSKLNNLSYDKIMSSYESVVSIYASSKPKQFSPVVDPDIWFDGATKDDIGKILTAIDTLESDLLRDFFRVCLSSCIRKLSYADPRLSVPVRSKEASRSYNFEAISSFSKAVTVNAARLQQFQSSLSTRVGEIYIGDDARNIHKIIPDHGQADMILTSPPYVGAQKYIRASSLSIGWLDLAPDNRLRLLEQKNIGREHYSKSEYETIWPTLNQPAQSAINYIREINPLRAYIAANYLIEMGHAVESAFKLLRPGGCFVLIIGDNQICGRQFETSRHLADIIVSVGGTLQLELVDDIKSRGLMTKRNKTAGVINREHILVFTKNGTEKNAV